MLLQALSSLPWICIYCNDTPSLIQLVVLAYTSSLFFFSLLLISKISVVDRLPFLLKKEHYDNVIFIIFQDKPNCKHFSLLTEYCQPVKCCLNVLKIGAQNREVNNEQGLKRGLPKRDFSIGRAHKSFRCYIGCCLLENSF